MKRTGTTLRTESDSSDEQYRHPQHHHPPHKDGMPRNHPNEKNVGPPPPMHWEIYPIADPAIARKLSSDIVTYCSADFERYCLSQSTGLADFWYFAGHHRGPPYPVLPGVEEPLFNSVRGRGRRAIEDIRMALYIHESPRSEIHCLLDHMDLLQPSCENLLTLVLPPPKVPSSPPPHPQVHLVLLFIMITALYFIIRKRLAKRQESITALLEGLHNDAELKSQVEEKLGLPVPEPQRIPTRKVLSLIGIAVTAIIMTVFILISSLEITAWLIYSMDTHYSTTKYVAMAFFLSTVVAGIGSAILHRLGLSLIRSLVLPATSITILSIAQHSYDFAVEGGTSTYVAMLLWMLVVFLEIMTIKGIVAGGRWAYSSYQSHRYALAPSAPDEALYVPLASSPDGMVATFNTSVRPIQVTFAAPPTYL